MPKVFCTKCGAQNEGDGRYCISCGAELVLYDQEASAAPLPGPPVYPGHPDYDEEIVPHPNLPVAGDSLGVIISKSFSLYFENFGIFFGSYWIMQLIIIPAFLILYFIPVIGTFAMFAVTALLIGVWYVFIRAIRGQSAEIGQLFTCLEKKYVPALLANLIRSIALGIITFIIYAAFFMDTFLEGSWLTLIEGPTPDEDFSNMWEIFQIGAIAALVSFLLALFFYFMEPLIASTDTDFWTAIKASFKFVWRHFWNILLLAILGGLISFAGFLVLFVGMFFTAPITYIFIACYFEAHKDEFDLEAG